MKEKSLREITAKEATEIGNMAFRIIGRKKNNREPYTSKKWKLHLFEDQRGNLEKIAIVDEIKPLTHIDNLWSKSPEEHISNSEWRAYPRANFIEIEPELNVAGIICDYKIEMLTTMSINLMLEKRSQQPIFLWLQQHGFYGPEYSL